MADEAVEVVGRRGAGVGLHVDDFGLIESGVGKGAGGAGGVFERRALGHVDDDLKLAFVVEGEHFDFNESDVYEGAGGEEHDGDGGEEGPAEEGLVDQFVHPTAVEDGEFAFFNGVAMGAIVLEQTDCRPRSDQEGDEEREDHGGGGADGDGLHVWPHQAADEGHG